LLAQIFSRAPSGLFLKKQHHQKLYFLSCRRVQNIRVYVDPAVLVLCKLNPVAENKESDFRPTVIKQTKSKTGKTQAHEKSKNMLLLCLPRSGIYQPQTKYFKGGEIQKKKTGNLSMKVGCLLSFFF